jgi:hypothetical protein
MLRYRLGQNQMNCGDTFPAGQASTTTARAIHNSARAIHRTFSNILRTSPNILEHSRTSRIFSCRPFLSFLQTLFSTLSTKFSPFSPLKTFYPSLFHLCEDLLSLQLVTPSQPFFYLFLATTLPPPNGHCPSAADRALAQRGGGCNSSCFSLFLCLAFLSRFLFFSFSSIACL